MRLITISLHFFLLGLTLWSSCASPLPSPATSPPDKSQIAAADTAVKLLKQHSSADAPSKLEGQHAAYVGQEQHTSKGVQALQGDAEVQRMLDFHGSAFMR